MIIAPGCPFDLTEVPRQIITLQRSVTRLTLPGQLLTQHGSFMKLQLTSVDFAEIIYENDYPFATVEEDGIREMTVHTNFQFGRVEFREMGFSDMRVAYGNMQLRNPTILRVEGGAPLIQLHFSLSGNVSYAFEDQPYRCSFNGNQHNMLYMPYMKGNLDMCHRENIKTFEVGITPGFFKRLAGNVSPLLDAMLKNIETNAAANLGCHPLPIMPETKLIIQDILCCQRAGYLKKLFIEAKVIELFLHQVEQFEQINGKGISASLRKSDIEKIHQVKAVIEQKMDEPFSLLDLSRMVGINDFKLKKGFREIYGTTVFGYLHDLKMQRAKQMLLNLDTTISEVSRLAGFKNQTHFTVAFKRKFGVVPGKIARHQ